jgi:hypothetical protein
MELHVQKFVRSAQDDEETLYFRPPLKTTALLLIERRVWTGTTARRAR